jgi:multiple sugar transport system permease protein
VTVEAGPSRALQATRRPRSPVPTPWKGYAFIAPNLVGLAVFTFLPVAFTIAVAFTNWDVVSGLSGLGWVGLRNFATILSDPDFWHSAGLTVVYVGFSVPLTVACGLAVAVALDGPVPGRSILRLLFFVPFISNLVAVSETWILLYSPQFGPIDAVLRTVGVQNPPAWLASSAWAMPALIIMTIWSGVGYSAVLYTAALQDVPTDLLEAAEIDGAGVWARFARVTFPILTPITFLLVLTGLINTSQTFGAINLLTQGGPGQSTTVLSYYIYQNAFRFYHFGYAAAMSVVMVVVVVVLALLLWLAQRRFVHYG